ncbi:tRNA methyltransferase tyw3 [Linnemannia gamsii]|uniref:tRNA(Phe) (4-demethylwyosine(37)-C(7)) aminocarboxypropyltransferase n=1 Tax=Linnemannia gamsii TaxID=64522 RepID=A0ABQ7K667_9FUNG|nr:tRNA methyltransferase tyw3 [Linnemannia gamsii]
MSTTTSIPVLLAPGHLTKHLKVFLDKAAWRDKAKLITRYAQITDVDQSTTATTTVGAAGGLNKNCSKDGCDLTQYMALALLPVGPFSPQPTTSPSNDIHSLWDLTQDSSLPDLSLIDWPAPLSDPTLHKTIFLTWLSPSAFPTPRHLLVQTPLEKLQQTASEFLLPYLQSWAIFDLEHGQGHEQQGRLTPDILPDLLASLPQKWEHYSDFTFLPPTAFLTAPWPAVLKRLITLGHQQQQQHQHGGCSDGGDNSGNAGIMARWEKLVQDALGSTHIARKAIIPVQDILRRPKIRPLAGDWKLHNRYKSWIEVEENDEEKGGSTGANLLEHQEMSSNLSSSKANAIANRNTPVTGAGSEAGAESTGLFESTTSSNNDVLPTSENFSKTYWSETCQNQVFYCWSPMFTMFSAGNITEKERVANSRPLFDARNKVVVDLYAGIGYFALVYLIHAGARTVHACEWNPWSVEGLVRGAGRNGIPWTRYHGENVRIRKLKGGEEDYDGQSQGWETTRALQEQPFTTGHPTPRRPQPTQQTTTTTATTTAATKKQKDYGQLVVYPGDNAQWIEYFENTAHHVNLGLIPTAEPGWVLGVRALCPLEGGYLHVHHNIRVGEEESFKSYLLQSLRDLFTTWKKSSNDKWSIEIRHMENVKSFAPLVFHYVVDVECRPPLLVTSS